MGLPILSALWKATILWLFFVSVNGGHEVLDEFIPNNDSENFQPSDLLIFQFETRPLGSTYWTVSAQWNSAYAAKYGHNYALLSMKENCTYGFFDLSPVWCKVKAMVAASYFYPDAKLFLYLDSDTTISVNHSMTHVVSFMSQQLHWDMTARPVAFNQDGPGWACKHALHHGYPHCFNSGTVLWKASPLATSIIESWWHSSGDPYSSASKFRAKWRQRWPWEQAQMYKVYEMYEDQIQILSFPDLPHLPWLSTKNPKSQYPTDTIEPWCFSHWPGANCFITHHCSSMNQKKKMNATLSEVNKHVKLKIKWI